MNPPIGVTTQARMNPPIGIAPPPPDDDTVQARVQPPVGVATGQVSLLDTIWIWLQSRLSASDV
jgi:hypothetical protein